MKNNHYALAEDVDTMTIALIVLGPKDAVDITLENESRVSIVVPALKVEEISGFRFNHNSLPTEQKQETIVQFPSM
jgi:hypothetical protein